MGALDERLGALAGNLLPLILPARVYCISGDCVLAAALQAPFGEREVFVSERDSWSEIDYQPKGEHSSFVEWRWEHRPCG